MSRRSARKHIFNLIFQTEFQEEKSAVEMISTYNEEYQDFFKADFNFIEREYKGIIANIDYIDSIIDKYSIGWNINRLAKTDLAILRIGVFEILFDDEIPNGVAVNEAVELSKEFCDDKSPSFINALLVKVSKSKDD